MGQTARTTRHPSRTTRALLVVFVALLTVAAFAVVASRLLPIARLEGEVSELIRPASPGVPDVQVTLSGVEGDDDPLHTHHADTMTVRSERAPRPQVGAVTVEAEAHGVTLPPPTSQPGPARAHADRIEVTVEISDFVLTRMTGIHVTRLASAADTSLVGGPENIARITLAGSWPEGSGPSGDVLLDLSADSRGGLLEPHGPNPGFPRIRLAPDVLPLGIPVESVVVDSGTIRASGIATDIAFPLAGLGGEEARRE